MGNLLQPLKSKVTHLKAGFFGGGGTGKTFTASIVMRDLAKMIGTKKPVAFVDTENGVEFMKERIFEPAGIEVLALKTRSLPDLMGAIQEAEKECFGLVVDSISEIWEQHKTSFLDAINEGKKPYQRQHSLNLYDWGPIKNTWKGFTKLYLDSKTHIILCGRESNIYENREEMVHGKVKRTAEKVGTKMKSENEQAYEPNLLCQFEKIFTTGDQTGSYKRRCHVIKDRFDLIDSKDFDDPTFKDFLPHIEKLDFSGTAEKAPIADSVSGEKLFNFAGEDMASDMGRRRAIALDEIESKLVYHFPDQTKASKKVKMDILLELLGSYNWTAISQDYKVFPLEKLVEITKDEGEGLSKLEKLCIKKREEGAGI